MEGLTLVGNVAIEGNSFIFNILFLNTFGIGSSNTFSSLLLFVIVIYCQRVDEFGLYLRCCGEMVLSQS